MAKAPTAPEVRKKPAAEGTFQPYVPDDAQMPEFTWSALVMGSLLGIVFGASSLYLVLKVGMTVSASIPVAVLSITLFRVFSKVFGFRRTTILENNIVQTAGSAGESIAFGVGATMPAIMMMGFDLTLTRVMVVSLLGGLLGILMMIPLRRAFIVKLHGGANEPGKLLYPEGTACAEVLKTGETGGTSGAIVFVGFLLAFGHKFITEGMNMLMEVVSWPMSFFNRAAEFRGEMESELLGVGYIIGARTSSIMMAGAVLGYLVIAPIIALFGDAAATPIDPAKTLIKDMDLRGIRENYLLFVGAGCVAAAGIISMFRTLPMIMRSVGSGLRGLSGAKRDAAATGRTEDDMSMRVVVFGSLFLLGLLTAFLTPEVGWQHAVLGSLLVLFFGFLFVTVSSRLTGEIGSSSNPISGMTVATLLLTCLIFLWMEMTSPADRVLALSIGGVVCIAASNGGTTSQDLKTGYLVGATPRWQQWAILIGAITSALVIGVTLMVFNKAGTVYSKKPENLPRLNLVGRKLENLPTTTYHDTKYREWRPTSEELPTVRAETYFVDDKGQVAVMADPAIMGKLEKTDDGSKRSFSFEAPKTQVMALIVNGLLEKNLRWDLILVGAMIAFTLELSGVSSLAFAVGVYVPIQYSTPIFLGGAIRWMVDAWSARRSGKKTDDEVEAIVDTESSPGVLLASGYIAGGSLAGVLIAFLSISESIPKKLSIWQYRKYAVAQDTPTNDVFRQAAADELGIPLPSAAERVPPDLKNPTPEQEKLRAVQKRFEDEYKEIYELNADSLVEYYEVPRGVILNLGDDKTFVTTENSRLGQIAQEKLGSSDRAVELLELNPKGARPPSTLPKSATIKLPQKSWPALIAFAVLSAVLLYFGTRLTTSKSTD